MRDQLDQLAAEVQAAGIDRPTFESLVLRLSPQERRLFLRLARGPALTTELRQVCSIGNVSQARASLNAKLASGGDPRRVACRVRPHSNVYGERGQLGEWQLVSGGGGEQRAA
jgi:hypothetical protein